MAINLVEIEQTYHDAECLYTREQVEDAIKSMSVKINATLKDKNPLVISVLSGAIIPAGILLSHLDFPLEIDYLHATRYRGTTQGQEIHWLAEPRNSLKDRVVLIVDDILDVGDTLKAIIEYCYQHGASKVYSAVLVKKIHDRNTDIDADFIGVETEDRYLFGFGMDYKEYLRNAPGIFAVKEV